MRWRYLLFTAFVLTTLVSTWAAPHAWPAAVALLLAGTWLSFRGTVPKGEMRGPTFRAVALVPLAIGLLIPGAIGLITAAHASLGHAASAAHPQTWQIALTAAGFLAAVAAARRWPERRSDLGFLLAAMALAALVRVAYLICVEMEPVSDFAGMWRQAGHLAEGDWGRPAAAASPVHWLHFERVLPYLLPVRWLLGESRWAYALPNVLLTLLCSLFVYFVGRRYFGRQAARSACVVSLVAVEPILASGIPTHDIPGTAFALAAIALFLWAEPRVAGGGWWSVLGTGGLLGLLLFLADLQRGNALLLVAAFGFVLLYEAALGRLPGATAGGGPATDPGGAAPPAGWWSPRRHAALLVVPVLVLMAANQLAGVFDLRMPDEQRELWRNRALAGHTDSWLDGRQRDAVRLYYQRFDLSPEDWRQLTVRKLLTDVAHNPRQRVANYVRKSQQLFTLGRQLGFYVRGGRLIDGRTVSRYETQSFAAANLTVTVLFLWTMLHGVYLVWADPRARPSALLPAVYLALFATVLVLLFQPQSRYLFPIWYLGALYSGVALGRSGAAGRRQ